MKLILVKLLNLVATIVSLSLIWIVFHGISHQ